MKLRTSPLVAVMATLAFLASLVGVSLPASAASDEAVYKIATLSVNASDVSVKAETVKKASTKIEVKAFVKNGVRAKGSCPMMKSGPPRGRHHEGDCFRLRPGTVIDNSGRNRSGGRTYYQWTVKRGDNRFVFHRHHWTKASCGNPVRFRPRAELDETMVVMVKQFTKLALDVTVSATAKGSGTASVQCYTSSASATASASVSLYGKVSNHIVVRAKSRTKAIAMAVQRLSLSLRTQITASVKDQASVQVLAKGVASCSILIHVTPPPPPPPNCPPGSIYNPATGTCAKDGSTNPDPVVIPGDPAPGPDPQPQPGPGDYTSAACYWDDTQLPVAPRDFTLNPATNRYECPIGSFGEIIYA